ncbi:MAG: hypothetical protein ACOC6F_01370, partial [bacterium]
SIQSVRPIGLQAIWPMTQCPYLSTAESNIALNEGRQHAHAAPDEARAQMRETDRRKNPAPPFPQHHHGISASSCHPGARCLSTSRTSNRPHLRTSPHRN